MKKIFIATVALITGFAAQAQEYYDPWNDRGFISEMSRTFAILSVFALIAWFLITLFRMIMEYRLKNKMIDRGISDQLAAQMLKKNIASSRNAALKWFLMLVSTGAGFVLMGIFRPFGVHSIAIICFSVASGFLSYYILSKRFDQ